ncbi:MFS transporter [Streptomyces sp. TUS-ST3]|jgi:DHA1 family purine base/nucleoside efflux pump-like MFS transporter|uniref:MFS transporter n=1 Tax=Streptomyces sp. TUS-ST3 TaxID=3025591 RepID=UPI00235B4569|nr:MFS transporter [Streptomyces sp. TUS-ST3]GLP67467.1 MFS transporter [Streptomyces sp. TUS-ST3]
MSPSTHADPRTDDSPTGIGVLAAARLLCLAAGTFVISTGAYVMAGLLPVIQAELDISVGAVGRLSFAYAVAYALWAPVCGVLTRRWDRRWVLFAGMALFVGGTLVTVTAGSYGGMMAARVVAGAGAGMFTPAASAAAVAVVPPAWQARAVACIIGGLAAATVLAVPIASVVGRWAGFRPVLSGIAALGAVIGVALWSLPRIQAPRASGSRTDLAPPAGVVAVLLTVSCLVSVADFAVYTYVSPLLSWMRAGDAGAIGGLLFLYGCAGVVGNVVGGQLADRWGTRRTVILSLALIVLSTVAMPWAKSLLVICLVIALWGISGWMVVPALQSQLMRLRPDAPGVLAAMNASAIYTGLALGSLLGGFVISAGSVSWLGPFSGAVAAMTLIVYSMLPRASVAGARKS